MNTNVVITALLTLLIPAILFFVLEDVDFSNENIQPSVLLEQTERVFLNIFGIKEQQDTQAQQALNFIQQLPESNTETLSANEDESLKEKDVTYKVTYVSQWSAQTHPGYFPDSAHLSPFVAWSHSPETTIFQVGSLASEGVEKMAELGGTITLEQELEERIRSGVFDYIVGKRIDTPGTHSEQLKVYRGSTNVTLVSMLAPSPDWFAAVENVELYKDDAFLSSVQAPLVIYDAGTEEGSTFSIKNPDTDPRQPISSLTDIPADDLPSFGYVLFELVE